MSRPRFSLRRAALTVLAVGLTTAMLAAPSSQAAAPTLPAQVSAPAAGADPAAPVARRGERLGKWRCKNYRSPSVVGKTCARLTSLDQDFKVDYRRSFFNKFRKQTVPFSCSTSKTKTYTAGLTVTGKAEAGVIFAKVETSASASVSASYTTQDSASATFKVKPRRWAHCERGTYVYSFRGQVKRVRCNAGGCRNSKESFRGHAPSRDLFTVGPGRG